MKTKRGFTIVEMLAVIAVLGILMGIVVGLAGQAGRRSDVAKAQTDLQFIRTALEEYRLRNGEYPLVGLFNKAMADYAPDWSARTRNMDPWGTRYEYFRAATAPLEYHLWSRGPSRVHEVSGGLPVQGHPNNRDNITR